MATSVGLRELKNRLSYYLKLVRQGEHVTVTDRGREVAIIVPAARNGVEEQLLELVRAGVATWGGGKPAGAAVPAPGRGHLTSDLVLEDRR